MAGGIVRPVPLRTGLSPNPGSTASEEFTLDMDELSSAFTEKTRVFILNTPHNPTGKMFTAQELSAIASIVEKHERVIVVADEVYENIVFDDAVHNRFATLPGMWERTLTLSSAGASPP